jgi:hypothetical protein
MANQILEARSLGHPPVSLALLATPVPAAYHLPKAIGEVAYEAYNLYREWKDALEPE